MAEQFFAPEQLAELEKPLDLRNVKKTQGNDYVEGWHVIAEANRIFGHGQWERMTQKMEKLLVAPRKELGQDKPGYYAAYMAKVSITVYSSHLPELSSVIREGTGNGEGYGPTIGAAIESAAKEAETDAMKRAFMTFGWTFGLALYQKPGERQHVVDGAKQPPPKREFTPEQKKEIFLNTATPHLQKLLGLDAEAAEDILKPHGGSLEGVKARFYHTTLQNLKDAAIRAEDAAIDGGGTPLPPPSDDPTNEMFTRTAAEATGSN